MFRLQVCEVTLQPGFQLGALAVGLLTIGGRYADIDPSVHANWSTTYAKRLRQRQFPAATRLGVAASPFGDSGLASPATAPQSTNCWRNPTLTRHTKCSILSMVEGSMGRPRRRASRAGNDYKDARRYRVPASP